jgi:hypothetical protein
MCDIFIYRRQAGQRDRFAAGGGSLIGGVDFEQCGVD